MRFSNEQSSLQRRRGHVSKSGRSLFIVPLMAAVIFSIGYYVQSVSLDSYEYQLDAILNHEESTAKETRSAFTSLSSWTSPFMTDCRKFEVFDFGDEIFVETNQGFQMNIHDPTQDTVISNEIANKGSWEPHLIKGMQAALAKYQDAYFLDIGGNIGMWTLSAAAANRQTFTIEPAFLNYLKFCKSVNKNSFHDRIHLLPIAASDKLEKLALRTLPKNYGGTAVKSSNANEEKTLEQSAKGVPIDTLGLPTDRPVVMKIDVEGYELRALTGAMIFLKEANIVHINMELRCNTEKKYKAEWDVIFGLFLSKGLEPYKVDTESETRLDTHSVSSLKCIGEGVRYYDIIWKK